MPRRKRLRRNPMYVRAHDTEALDGRGRAVMVYTQEEVDGFRDEELIDYIAGIIDEKLTAARQAMASQARPTRERASATRPRAIASTKPRSATATAPRSRSTVSRSTRASTRTTPRRRSTRSSSEGKQVTFRSAQIIGDALGPMDEWAGDFLRLASETRRGAGRGTTVQRDEVLGLMGLQQSDANEIINQLRGVSSPSQQQAIVLDNFERLESAGRMRLSPSDPMPSSSGVMGVIDSEDIDI